MLHEYYCCPRRLFVWSRSPNDVSLQMSQGSPKPEEDLFCAFVYVTVMDILGQ